MGRTVHRPPSEEVASIAQAQAQAQAQTGGSLNKWGTGFLKKISNVSSVSSERASRTPIDLVNDAASSIQQAFDPRYSEPTSKNYVAESPEADHRQLHALILHMRSAPSAPRDVDVAYSVFEKIREPCGALCRAILQQEPMEMRTGRCGTDIPGADAHREPSLDSHSVVSQTDRSSFSAQSFAEGMAVSASGGDGGGVAAGPAVSSWLSGIRDWKCCLDVLLAALKTSLADTYRSYQKGATPDMVEKMFTNRRFRSLEMQSMRNASVSNVVSADPDLFGWYEIKFEKYDLVREEMREITKLLQSGESGISLDRKVEEYDISPRGDAVLEFANLSPDREPTPHEPVLRFRVSSHMLAETSPIFAHMLSSNTNDPDLPEDDEMSAQLPALPPSIYLCEDGSEARLYRMPQREFNREGALEMLLHAAHMHNDRIPRDVQFDQFVAIAEVCMRYLCTSPVELFVEHRWLPQWLHMGAEAMPDGLLLISYAFGLRRLFTRMTKSAILNITDERELRTKPWPQKIKDKVWAVRCAKMAQLHNCCISTMQEYLRAPTRIIDEEEPAVDLPRRSSIFETSSLAPNTAQTASPAPPDTAPTARLFPSSTPRCPKGSHGCDGNNLGFLMLVFSELQLLPIIMKPRILAHLHEPGANDAHQAPRRSLAQLVKVLRAIPSPPSPIHPGGVCDPAPAFRAAVSDIYNSVSGLTLFDITGQHGYSLSRHHSARPQPLLQNGLRRMTDRGTIGAAVVGSRASALPVKVMSRILQEVDTLEGLHALALVNRAFYQTYKENELVLMRNIVRAERRRTMVGKGGRSPSELVVGAGDEKLLKRERDDIRSSGADVLDATAPQMGETEVFADIEEEYDEEAMGEPEREAEYLALPTGPGTQTADMNARQSPSPPLSVILTHEEASRILWPEEGGPPQPPEPHAPLLPAVEGLREKFRAGDPAFTEGKSLSVVGDKQLRDEHDRRLKGVVVEVSSWI